MKKLREWLKQNKIFFETLAATLLSVMVIIISYYQINIGEDQTKLLEIQTELGQRQMEIVEKKEKVEHTARWGELRNTMWAIMDIYSNYGLRVFRVLSREQKLNWNREIRKLLDSQIDNPVLIENKMCLGYWRNAISRTQTLETFIKSDIDEEMVIIHRKGILNDILFVWEKIVLDSDEVSSTGGKPEEDDSLEID